MNERCHTNSVPWMHAIGLNKSGFTESTNCVHSWYGFSVTAVIHGTELMWPRSFMVRSWCDRGHSWYGLDVTAVIHGTELMWPRAFMVRSWCDREQSWYGVGVIPQSRSTWFLCTLYSGNSFGGFFIFVFHQWRIIHQISYIRTHLSTLRSWCNLLKWPYRVKKISIKWLLPVKGWLYKLLSGIPRFLADLVMKTL